MAIDGHELLGIRLWPFWLSLDPKTDFDGFVEIRLWPFWPSRDPTTDFNGFVEIGL